MDMDIMPLFPTALGKVSNFITEKERLKLTKSIKDTKHDDHGAILGDGASTHDPLDLSRLPSSVINKNIKNRLLEQVNKYAQAYGIRRNLKLDNIWSNIQNAGSALEEHYHPQSIISGALYLNVDDSCSITFHNPNPYIYFTYFVERNPFNYEWYKFSVNNADLILFPSWLKHGHHGHVNTMDNRMVVSFNSYYGK
tara:strand:- start:134 stop:721 length:588 start_codon:yes stop_codon:yes gene_type:complete